MSKRFFAATDGTFTIFRGTDRPLGYRYASFDTGRHGEPWNISFSNVYRVAGLVTVEITREQYVILTKAKMDRVTRGGGNPQWATSPQDCWVRNADVTVEAA